jgi:hypothetical protein
MQRSRILAADGDAAVDRALACRAPPSYVEPP